MKSRLNFCASNEFLRWSNINLSVTYNCVGFKVSRFLENKPKCFRISYCTESLLNNEQKKSLHERVTRKLLKIAIIGVPNVGKSTLINRIVGRNIFAVSSKVHTTRCRARAVAVVGDTQLVFLDTPGLVSVQESNKHHLESSFLKDSVKAIEEADVIGVVHDISNRHTKLKLDEKVLRLLFMYPLKHVFLVLNKVDALKTKRDLLDCVDSLTNGRRILDEDKMIEIEESGVARISENDLKILVTEQTGWPYFKDIFMVSALTGNGVGDIQIRLLQLAKPGEWVFTDSSLITDQKDHEVIERIVFAKLLDHLPNVIPYNLKVQLEYLNRTEEGTVTAVVLITAKKAKIKKLVMGKGGSRIKKIAADVEQNLRQFYLNDVHIRLILLDEEPSGGNTDSKNKLITSIKN